MSGKAEREVSVRGDGLSVLVQLGGKPAFPVDDCSEVPMRQIEISARSAYVADAGDPESVRPVGYGRHNVRGGRHVVALESGDRLYLTPARDCTLEYVAGVARLVGQEGSVAVAVKRLPGHTVVTGPEIDSLFHCVSALCSAPGETSPYRSHPFFRPGIPEVRLASGDPEFVSSPEHAPIHMHLPPDLRFLYAAAPLSCYLGATIDAEGGPSAESCQESVELPGDWRQFERWAGRMLSRMFQLDCAVRCSAARGMRLAGIDVLAVTGYAPEELMLMSLPDRFGVYRETLRSGGRAFVEWHAASYVDPVPSTVELLPHLLRSLSAIYTARGTPLSERDVVALSVRDYQAQLSCRIRGDGPPPEAVVLPSLYNAQAQHWYSGSYPVDATLSSIRALRNGRRYARDRRMPSVCVICNEPSMEKEIALLNDLLDGIAEVHVRTRPKRSDLLHTFSEGFDVVHYAGHCDRQGLKCHDGYADLSAVEYSDVPVFFLNSCFSYLQGARLIEKGSACGIATMFRLLDEAAMDVCGSFYRMLSRGYPVITSFLAARECSVTGKEYLLIGDGSYVVFNGRYTFMPFYKLSRNGLGFTLQCRMPPGEKGLIAGRMGDLLIPDTGCEMAGTDVAGLAETSAGLDGMCLYGNRLYDDVGSAVKSALIDFRRLIAGSRAKSAGP